MKALRIFAYLVAGAVIFGLVFSAVPALLNKPQLTKIAGLSGVGVGIAAAAVFGARRDFQ